MSVGSLECKMSYKYSNLQVLYHLGYPVFVDTKITTTGPSISSNAGYVATEFYAPYDITLNRIAFNLTTLSSPTMTVTAGIAGASTSEPSTFLSSTTSTTFVAGYNILSFSDFTCEGISPKKTSRNHGPNYFAALSISGYTTGSMTVALTLTNSGWILRNNPNSYYSSAKQIGLGTILVGYYNGTYTQWYGTPFTATTTRRLNATATNNDELGAKIVLPYHCSEYHITGLFVYQSMNANHTVTCNIYESDAQTMVPYATSSLSFNDCAVTSGSDTKFGYFFGNVVKLKPQTEYYISFKCTGTSAASAYTTFDTISIGTSDFSNCFNSTNIAYRRQFSTSAIEFFTSERMQLDLILEQPFGSFRGTKSVT